jgi:hypothetical protein
MLRFSLSGSLLNFNQSDIVVTRLIEQLQTFAAWAADLPFGIKVILSIIIVAFAALFLGVVWTTPSTRDKESFEAVEQILNGCYRKAVFTKTHAQMDHAAMFDSITDCRKLVESKIPAVSNPNLKEPTAGLFTALEGIEREKTRDPWDFSRIDNLKLEALRRLYLLAKLTGFLYIVPFNLTNEIVFSKNEANAPPTLPNSSSTK